MKGDYLNPFSFPVIFTRDCVLYGQQLKTPYQYMNHMHSEVVSGVWSAVVGLVMLVVGGRIAENR